MKARNQIVTLLLVLLLVALSAAAAQEPLRVLSELPPDQRAWVEQSCPSSFGPSLYLNCVRREINALRSGIPNLSTLSHSDRVWVEQSCPRSFGPSLYSNCVRREMSALAGGVPNLAHLPPESRSWIEQSCPRSFGPSLYTNCVRRESRALGFDTPSRRRSPASKVRSEPSPADPPPRITLQSSLFKWPQWQGKRPTLPAHASATPLDPSDLFRRTAPSVYVLVAAEDLSSIRNNPETAAQGSAVAVSSRHLITNCHVVEKRPEILVVRDDLVGRAKLLWADPESDRCFLQAIDLQLTPVSGIRPYRELSVGERVYSIGAPSGLDKTLGEGLISGLRQAESLHLIQTSAPISPGSFGGGLFDNRGNLIGITTLMIRDAQNLNFAIAAEDFWKLQ